MKSYFLGNYRVTVLSSTLVRVEYSKNKIFDTSPPLVLDPEFEKNFSTPLECKVSNTDNTFCVETDSFVLKLITNGRMLDLDNLSVYVKDTTFLWQPGVVDKGNLGGAMLDLYKYPAGKFHERFTEGLISKNGLFVYRDICEFLWDKEKNWIKKRSDWQFQDWFIFAYGKDYKQAFKDFVNLFGRVPLVPRWVFGYWYSRWYKFSDEGILQVIQKLRSLQIPIDVFVIDTDWRKHGWNGYEWNNELFPEVDSFIKKLKQLKIKICLNDHPGYGRSDELPQDDPYREKIKRSIPDIKKFAVKWDDERYVYTWMKEIWTKFLNDGVDFWWVDGWGGDYIPMDVQPQLWVNRFYFESAKHTDDNRRPVILSRWGGIGSHKYPVQFSGDTYSTWETLKYQIEFTHKGGNIGACYWSHDIGGFLGEKIPEDLYIRWVQFGCFSPVFRTHSCGPSRDVWEYSQTAVEVFKKYVRLRYALNPYFYTLARETYETGIPIIRGVYLEYPDDNNAYKYNDEYLIGKFILVAPVYEPGNVVVRKIYFPLSEWYELEEGVTVEGGCVKEFQVSLEKIPFFIKKGSIIPAIPVGEHLSYPVNEIEFTVIPDDEYTEFVYYEDDGWSQSYLSNEFIKQKVECKKDGGYTITIHPVEGFYDGMSLTVNYVVNLLVSHEQEIKNVYVNGQQIDIQITTEVFFGSLNTKFSFIRIVLKDIQRKQRLEIEFR